MELAHRLVNTRAGTTMLAILAAVTAIVLVLLYVNRYRDNVNAGATQVSVLVAQHPIAKGTAGEVVLGQSLFGTEKLRGDQAASQALTDASALRGQVATRDIAPGEQLTAGMFAGGISTMSTKLSGPQRAVAVPIDTARGLIGKIEAGDHVDVLAGFNVQSALSGMGHPVVKVLLQNIPVLAVNASDSGTVSPNAQSSTVTLRATDTQAAKLAYASDNGKIWLVLRPRAGAPQTDASLVSMESLLGTSTVTVGGK